MAKDGRKVVTTAGTRVSLGVSVDGASAVVITAETDNTDVVVVGGPTVVASLSTRRGTPLYPGETLVLPVAHQGDQGIWLDAVTNGDGVTYSLAD